MNDRQEGHPVEMLTDEQLEVLRLVGRGYKSKQIARMVQVSHFAVNSRIDRAVERLGVADRFEAGRLVIDFERPTYDAITHADDSVHLQKPGVLGEKEEPDGTQPGGFPWPFATSRRQDGLSTKQRLIWAVVGIPCLVMEAATNYLNSIQVNDCRMANRMIQIAKGDDNMSGIIEEMTGYKSISAGFANSYQQSREKIQANNNNPTEDLKDALQNCPAEVTDIFKTGSLLAHAAARVGAGDWADQMRARVGDVYMRWDTNDKVPLFSAIPACPLQDSESSDDFLTGKVQRRALNVPPTAKDCSQDGAKGALELARARMQSISDKIRTRGTLTDEEKQFVANVHTLPVYRLLEWGVREGVPDSVIGDTDDLVATSLAYQMLNDLTRSLNFAIDNAERGTTAAGAADATSKTICQTRILSKGIDQLRDLREEVLRQRAQMRQSYLAALSQAQVSASFASLLKSRDADARNQAGAAAGRHP